jgi:hypothetical protein
MFKVMCIDDEDKVHGFHNVHPKVGEECEVVYEALAYGWMRTRLWCYRLSGYPSGNAYNANNFIRLSNIDEKELSTNKIKENELANG